MQNRVAPRLRRDEIGVGGLALLGKIAFRGREFSQPRSVALTRRFGLVQCPKRAALGLDRLLHAAFVADEFALERREFFLRVRLGPLRDVERKAHRGVAYRVEGDLTKLELVDANGTMVLRHGCAGMWKMPLKIRTL
mgnify:CR=1 FL=1